MDKDFWATMIALVSTIGMVIGVPYLSKLSGFSVFEQMVTLLLALIFVQISVLNLRITKEDKEDE